jgi:hypothetical protein
VILRPLTFFHTPVLFQLALTTLAWRKHRSDMLDAPGLPALLIDFATLTGACIGALSARYAGAFSNREELNGALITAG